MGIFVAKMHHGSSSCQEVCNPIQYKNMVMMWDYDTDELKKTEKGRILMLERAINNGVYLSDKQKISLNQVKKYWRKLHLEPGRRKLLKLLIWGN